MTGAGGASLARAGLVAGLGRAVLIGIPTVAIGGWLGYGLSNALDVRRDEFSKRATDGESPMMRAPRKTPS